MRLLTLLLFFCGCVVALVAASCGGLMATKLYTSAQSKAAGWNQAGNFGGGVLGAALVLRLVEHLSLSAVGLATAALVLLPALVAFTVPEAPPTPSRWFRGRFTEIRREALAVLRSPKRRWGVELLVYVGGFEDNAFTRRANHNRNSDLIPSDTREILMAHEFTHAIQIGMGSFSGSFQRTVGTIVVAEGLASRVTEKLFPNRPETDNIEFTHGWLKEAEQRKAEILQDIRPFLTSDKPDDIERFTIGPGPAGLEREAYFAGWLVVGDWLAHGMSFSEIACIPEKEMPQRAAAEIDAILAATKR